MTANPLARRVAVSDAGEKQVLVGRIVGLSGVGGMVKLESWTDPRTQIFSYQPWQLKSAAGIKEISAARGREQGKGMVAELPGISDREAAAALVGSEIWVARSVLPKAAPGQHYWFDLEGLEVVNIEGVELGRVSHLIATGSNDVLVARHGDRERLIPFIDDDFVKSVDLEAQRITVDWDPEF